MSEGSTKQSKQPALRPKSKGGRKNTDWAPVKLQPQVQRALDIIKLVLADGGEHSTTEFTELFKENKIPHRNLHYAIKEIKPHIDMVNRGRGGAFYRLKDAQGIPPRPEDVPMEARSAALAQAKAPVSAQTLRMKVDTAVPGYDPIVAIAAIANDPTTPVAVRLECHRDVAKYLVPQVKAVEISTDDQPIALNFKWES